MTLTINIKERMIRAAILFFFLLGAWIYASAQIVPVRPSGDHPASERISNVGAEIKHADHILLHSKAVPLNESINGPYTELKPAMSPNGNRLYFSRHLHPENTLGENDLEDIWYTEFNKEENAWTDPIRMAGTLNNAGPNFINSVSPTGDTIILGNRYGKKGKMKAGLSYSVNVKGQWSVPVSIDIKNDYNVSDQANYFVSLSGGVIISAIQRAETYGGRDLYVSFWNGEQATEPINMGGVINTDLEESSPFLDSDNKTLYFASKGHNGYGGYDIWVTKRLDETWTNWSEPENLGPAVNGSMDDEFFSLTHCGNYAIFSKQVTVHNTDLYRISVEELFAKPTKKLKGFTKENSALASL